MALKGTHKEQDQDGKTVWVYDEEPDTAGPEHVDGAQDEVVAVEDDEEDSDA